MNRKERRRNEIKRQATYILNEEQIQKIRADAVEEATKLAVMRIIYCPLMVMEGHADELEAIREKDARLKKFLWLLMEQINCIEDTDVVSINDMREYLKTEYDLEIVWK